MPTRGRPRGQPAANKKINPATLPVLRDLFALQNTAGMTDAAMAEHAGYNAGDVASWRSGNRVPRLRTLADYASMFGCEIRLVKKGMPNGLV
jgi:hypothetical protein